MKKDFIFLFMVTLIAMSIFTSCNNEDAEDLNTTEQVEDFATLVPKLVFKSGWVEGTGKLSYLHFSTKDVDGKVDGVECEISFTCKTLSWPPDYWVKYASDGDGIVDLNVKYRNGGSWIVLKVGKGYPIELGNEGSVAFSWKNKSAGIYNVNLAIPELGYEGKVVARNVIFDISTTITLP